MKHPLKFGEYLSATSRLCYNGVSTPIADLVRHGLSCCTKRAEFFFKKFVKEGRSGDGCRNGSAFGFNCFVQFLHCAKLGRRSVAV